MSHKSIRDLWFWLLLILLSVALITVPASVTPNRQFEPTSRKLLEKGITDLYDKHFVASSKEFRRAINCTSQKRDIYIRIIDTHMTASESLGLRADGIAADYLHEVLQLNDQKKLDKPIEKKNLGEWLYVYGSLCYRLNRTEDAIIAYENALKITPDDPRVLNDLGYTYAESGKKIDRALDLTRHAVKVRPNESMYVDSLGWAYYKAEMYHAAVRELKNAVRMCPTSAELRYHLGAAYSQMGKNVEAAIELRKSLAIDPGCADARILLDKIRRSPRINKSKV